MPKPGDDAPRRRCDNPDCAEFVTWPERSSRPQRFCSSACRQRCRAKYGRLVAERRKLKSSEGTKGMRYVDRRAVQSRLAMVDWLLSAYPGAYTDPSLPGPSTTSSQT